MVLELWRRHTDTHTEAHTLPFISKDYDVIGHIVRTRSWKNFTPLYLSTLSMEKIEAWLIVKYSKCRINVDDDVIGAFIMMS